MEAQEVTAQDLLTKRAAPVRFRGARDAVTAKSKLRMNPTIWVVNDAGHPTWLAQDLVPGAEIKPLTRGRDFNPLFVDRLIYHLAEGIGKYAREGDYLLISGSPAINAFALSLWLIKFTDARVLQWNATDSKRCYELSTISRATMEKLLENFMSPVG